MSAPIYTAADLGNIASNLAGDYIQMADIDLTGMDWIPLGNGYPDTFTGSYDGNGFTISNMTVGSAFLPDYSYGGLFGSVGGNGYSPSLMKIVLLNCNVVGNNLIFGGCLCGALYSGSVTECYGEGLVNVAGAAGGLIGDAEATYSDITIDNCAFAPFKNSCSVETEPGNTGVAIGGLIGVTYTYRLRTFTITDCYAASPVIPGSSDPSNVMGGMTGYNYGATYTSCYYDETVSGQSDTGNGTPELTALMQEQSTYSGWDFTDIWQISPLAGGDFGYPYFKWMAVSGPQCKASQVLIDARSGKPVNFARH